MRQFTFFLYAYESVLYLSVFVLHCLILALVLRSPWRQHLRWAVPAVVGIGIEGIHLFIVDLQVYARLLRTPQIFLVDQATYVCATLVSFYSIVMFYVVVKQSLHAAAGKDLFTQTPAATDPTAWPPPPRLPS